LSKKFTRTFLDNNVELEPPKFIFQAGAWKIEGNKLRLISNPNLLEGTLAYMSPKQTGRMNRSVDYQTDFYSLGVAFI
jgi:serine/threonine protein kinase